MAESKTQTLMRLRRDRANQIFISNERSNYLMKSRHRVVLLSLFVEPINDLIIDAYSKLLITEEEKNNFTEELGDLTNDAIANFENREKIFEPLKEKLNNIRNYAKILDNVTILDELKSVFGKEYLKFITPVQSQMDKRQPILFSQDDRDKIKKTLSYSQTASFSYNPERPEASDLS